MRLLFQRVMTALLVAALVMAPGAATARAAADPPAMGAEEAGALARSLLPVPAAAVKQANLEVGRWILTWQTPAGNTDVDIDSATGVVYRFARQLGAPRPFRYTAEEARTVAERWLAKLAPDLAERLRPTGLVPLFSGCFTFTWERLEQGYPVRGDGVLIRIDGHTGELSTYMRMSSPHGSMVAPAVLPDPDAALKRYRERVGLTLEYRQAFRPGGNLAWWLVYRPTYSFPYLDMAGNFFDQAGTPLQPERVLPGQVVPPVAELPPRPAKPLSAAEAVLVAQAALHTPEQPESSQFQPWAGWHGGFWQLSWASGAYAAVDAETGLLVGLGAPPAAGAQPDETPPAPQATAIEFVRRFRPDLAGRLAVTSPAADPTVQFQVLKDGIPLNNRFVAVDVAPASGQVTGFRVLPMEAAAERFPFADPAGVLSAPEAMTAFLRQSPLELTWVSFERAGGWVTELMWAPRSAEAGEVAAHSGIVMAPGGMPITAPGAPADLAGHPARDAVQLLSFSGIVATGDGAFRPDEPAALTDLTVWLEQATGRKTAPPGLGPDADLAAAPSRQLFALWAVQAAGYGPVAAMKARIELPFADRSEIGPEYANAAGLLAGLGIIPADRFEPQRAVTRGEAALIIQGIITDLQEDAAP